ncbi:MAG: DUF2959 family protein [Balneolaceae bacterium]
MILNRYAVILITFLIGCGCATTGSNTSGLERSERSLSSMEILYDDIQETISGIDEVESSLRNLKRSGQTDVESAFQEYSDDVSDLEETGNNMLENKSEMEENTQAYFSGWEEEGEEYENQRLQELSRERRSELKETYNQVTIESSGVERELNNFISDAKDLRAYLSNDLTSSGIDAISPLADDLMDNSEDLKEKLRNTQSALERSISEMARSRN